MLSSQCDSTNECGLTIIAHNQHSSVSNLTTKNQVDTDSNNDDNIHFFANTRKHNYVTPEIRETSTKTTPVQPNVYYHLFQMSSSTSTTSLKLRPSIKKYICFQIGGKSSHEAKCVKLRTFTKVIGLIIDI